MSVELLFLFAAATSVLEIGVVGTTGTLRRLKARRRANLAADLDIARGGTSNARAAAEERLARRSVWSQPAGSAALRALVHDEPPDETLGSPQARLIGALARGKKDQPADALTEALAIDPGSDVAWGRYRAFVCARIGVELADVHAARDLLTTALHALEATHDLPCRAYGAWLCAAAGLGSVEPEDDDMVVLHLAQQFALEAAPTFVQDALARRVARLRASAAQTHRYR